MEHGLQPRVIAAFNEETGKRLLGIPIDVAEYLAVAPDIITPAANPEDPPVLSRPVAYQQTHTYAGWPAHIDEEED